MCSRTRRGYPRIAVVAVVLGCLAPTADADPRTDYMLHCQGCHQADGRGAPGRVPSFLDYLGQFASLPSGREYLIRVPGTSQSELSNERVAAVLNWMLQEFSPDHAQDCTAFTASEVARWRRPPLTDVESVRRRLVQEIELGDRDRTRNALPDNAAR